MRTQRTVQSILIALFVLLLAAGCAPRVTPPSREDRVVMHQVAAGETLQMIAEDYYGDPSRAAELRHINGLDDDIPEPGTVVQIVLNARELDLFNVRKQARIPYNTGLELTATGDYLEAIGKFQDALTIDPTFSEARYNLGVTFQKMKKYESALSHFSGVLRQRPDHAGSQFGAGTCHFYLGQYEDAVSNFERVLAADPAHLKARYSLAVSYEKLGRPDRARVEWERYLQIDGSSEWAREARKRLEKLSQ